LCGGTVFGGGAPTNPAGGEGKIVFSAAQEGKVSPPKKRGGGPSGKKKGGGAVGASDFFGPAGAGATGFAEGEPIPPGGGGGQNIFPLHHF